MTHPTRRKIAFHPKCMALAEHFVRSRPEFSSPEQIRSLATAIQHSVETWFIWEESLREPTKGLTEDPPKGGKR